MENLDLLASVIATTTTPVLATPTSATPALATPALTTPATATTLTWEITTKFKDAQQLTFRIRPKDDRFVVVIPAKAGNGKRRAEIGFSKVQDEGLSSDFGEFLYKQLRQIVTKWKTLSQAKKWVASKSSWREKMHGQWRVKSKRKTRMSSKRKLNMVRTPSPSPFKAKNKTTVSFPVAWDETIAVRMYERCQDSASSYSRKRSPHLIVWIPTKIVKCSKEFSMGIRFGVGAIWKQYVSEYLQYAVSRWTSPDVAREWYKKYRNNFVQFVNSLFAERQYSTIPITRPWYLAPSKMTPNERFDRWRRLGWFPKKSEDGDYDQGYGVYAKYSGRHTLCFSSADPRIVVLMQNSSKLTPMQKYYRVVGGENEDKVWVPTVDALNCGVMPEAFYVNSSPTKDTATHALDVNLDGTTDLSTEDKVHSDVELSFDYNYTEGESSSEEDDVPWDEPVEDGGMHYIAHPINKASVGQCLFVAMEHQLSLIAGRDNMTYSHLRRLAVQTQRSAETVPGVSRTEVQLKRMLRAGTYGDNHEVAALSQALEVNVRLCQVRDQTVSWIQLTDHNPSLPTMRLMLYYKSRSSSVNHYMSMVPLD